MDIDETAPTAPTAPSLTRCNDLWFDDGNIVLQAGLVQYKVYRGTLARHSPVFQDMLAFPQPAEPELVEGLPLVTLPDDAEDFTPFLRALFDPDYFRPFPARTTYDIIRGCLRMSHKYAVDFLRRRAVAHFSSYWRTDLDEWDDSCFSADKSSGPASEIISWDWDCGDEIPTKLPRLLSIALLAREVEATWTLPSIFYVMAMYFQDLGPTVMHGFILGQKKMQLSLEDRAFCVAGAERQMVATWDILSAIEDPTTATSCVDSAVSCALAILAAAPSTQRYYKVNYRDPLRPWPDRHSSRFQRAKLCARCLGLMKSKHAEARRKFWNDLSGLPKTICSFDISVAGMRSSSTELE
uniref:BTB domain-containing protein n=1 Tax=Mycena chlorophos TaxID=658473 RepID=A0ABQ0LDU3_MYCCL|nr:predicted protein [Mycena chlorophos]